MGLVPVYAADGTNGTSILLEGKDAMFSPLKTKTLLGQLCRAFLLDLQVARLAFSRVWALLCHPGGCSPRPCAAACKSLERHGSRMTAPGAMWLRIRSGSLCRRLPLPGSGDTHLFSRWKLSAGTAPLFRVRDMILSAELVERKQRL